MKTLSDHPLLIGKILARRERRMARRAARAFRRRHQDWYVRLLWQSAVLWIAGLTAMAVWIYALFFQP